MLGAVSSRVMMTDWLAGSAGTATCSGYLLTGEEQPELSSHALRDPLEDELFGLLRAVHAHPLSVLCKVVLPRLLL